MKSEEGGWDFSGWQSHTLLAGILGHAPPENFESWVLNVDSGAI